MTDADAEMIAELERCAARFMADPKLCRTRDFDIITRKDSIETRYEGEWVRDSMRALPRLLALAKEAQATHAEAERLREALAPFAQEASVWAKLADDARLVVCDPEDPSCCSPYDLHVSDFRKASLAQEQRDE